MNNKEIIKKLNHYIEMSATTIVITDDLADAVKYIVAQCSNDTKVLFINDATNTITPTLPTQFTLANKIDNAKYDAYNNSVLVINKDCTALNDYSKILLRITSNYYKNKNSYGSIGIATDIESISSLFDIISHNPPIINQLLISHECAKLLLAKLD